jgi:hypothetical protein
MPQILQIYERALMADTLEMAYVHYSAKTVKTILPEEQYAVAESLLTTIPALLYGFMPNMPLYTKPDGPCENPSEIMQGRIQEALGLRKIGGDAGKDILQARPEAQAQTD